MFIATHCPSMRVEALKMAIQYVMGTYNVTLYQQLHKKLQESIGYLLMRLPWIVLWNHLCTSSHIFTNIFQDKFYCQSPWCCWWGCSIYITRYSCLWHSLGGIEIEKSCTEIGEAGHWPKKLQKQFHQRKHTERSRWFRWSLLGLWGFV